MRTTIKGLRKIIAWALFAALALGLYCGWGALSQPSGSQRVALTPALAECASDGRLRYCIYRAREGTNGDILYHLHGRNLDETVWNDDTYYTAMLQAHWQAARNSPPTVVSLSYGGTWLLAPRGAGAESGLLDDMIARLPAIERKVGVPRRRMLLGESMGGLNVLVAGLSHPDRFDRIAALCPGVYKVSPFAPLGEIRAAMSRTGANPRNIFGIWSLARSYYADDAEWRASSPLTLIKTADAGSPRLYLSNGLYDAYGNFEGTQELARLARERGVTTEWRPLYGGHCVTDVPSLAAFLTA